MTKHSKLPAPGALAAPVPTRARHDGWTPERQHDFIAALAESGCITAAAKAVGMSAKSAYCLRARPDASHFRQAWEIALDFAVRRLSEAAFSRALNGVATPVFFQGEQIGERRRYDERLTMFLLRYRDPVRYGAWNDSYEARRHPDGAAVVLAHALNAVVDSASGFEPEPADGDSGDGEAEGEGDGTLPRPLAEGPPRAAASDARARMPEGLGPDGEEVWLAIQAAFPSEPKAEPDPTRHDGRAPLTVRRPLKAPKARR